MSKITIIPSANRVTIDGESERVVFNGAPNIHAIHWDEESSTGEIEYTDDTPNETITNFNPYNHFIADHTVAGDLRNQAALDKAAEREAALTNEQKRELEYPSVIDHLYALHLARKGDTTVLDAVDEQYVSVDALYPL